MRLIDRLFAASFDVAMHWVDGHGAAEHRRRLVGEARGEVLEIGAGTGRNLGLYQRARRVVALEPAPAMRARAQRRAGQTRVEVEVVDGDAMALPFPDNSFDTVVASLVFCTIPTRASSASPRGGSYFDRGRDRPPGRAPSTPFRRASKATSDRVGAGERAARSGSPLRSSAGTVTGSGRR